MVRTCMSSSQFGHPSLRKSAGVWTREQSRHARRAFARGCGGIAACTWDMLGERASEASVLDFEAMALSKKRYGRIGQ